LANLSTSLSAVMAKYYDNVFLEAMQEKLVLDKWTDKKTVPLWRGKTVSYFAYYPITPTTTAITEGSSTNNEVIIAAQTVEATVAKYAQWVPYTELVKLTSRDKNLQGAVKLFGNAAAESLEMILAAELFQKGSIPIRVDQLSNSTTNTFEGTIDASASATTTTFKDATLTQNNSFWKGAHFAALAGSTQNYRYGSMVSDWASTGDAGTLTTAAPVAFTAATTKYRMVSGSGLAAANIITGTALEYAVAKARENKFYTFPGGWFKASLAPQVEYDLQKNTVFRNLGQYQQASKLEKGDIGQLWGVDFNRCTIPYRETVAGVYDAAGVVFCTPIMGMHALGNVSLAGMREHKILMKFPGPTSTNEPYDEKGTIAYRFYAAPKALNASWCINLMSGATGVA